MRPYVSLIVIGLLLAVPSEAGSELAKACLSLRITNCVAHTVRMASSGATLCADVWIEPAAEHQWLEVTWEYAEDAVSMMGADSVAPMLPPMTDDVDDLMGPDPSLGLGPVGGGGEDLDGVEEPRGHKRKMAGLSGGTYEVTARVCRDVPPSGGRCRQVCGVARERVTVR